MDPNTIVSFKSVDLIPWATVVATIALVVLTAIYVWLTHKILRAQSDPSVIVSVIHDDKRPTILQLIIRNIGRSIAHDIKFEPSRPIPAHAWGITLDEAKVPETMSSGPLVDGIPALGPGEERKIDWGQYGGLLKCLGEEPIIVKCSWKNNVKRMPPITCKLEVKSFASTCIAEDAGAKSACELEKIAKELNYMGSGFHKLKVEVVEQKETPHGNGGG